MHSLTSSFVLGYHGCDEPTAERLLRNEPFEASANDYDWLGPGVYFWEANPDRALQWALEVTRRKALSGIQFEAAVVGAVIDPGFCLDLVSSNGIAALEGAYAAYQLAAAQTQADLPRNAGGTDLRFRNLDCAVITYLHDARSRKNESPFDTVRGVFIEGDRLYENSGFFRKTHIQICVRNPNAIKGVFRVPEQHFSPFLFS